MKSQEAGFTLLELLVVVGITGILTAIAVPQFNGYKNGGFDVRAQLALRTVATAQEGYFLDYDTYKDCNQSTCPGLLDIDPISSDVTLQITATTTGFTGTATNTKGSGVVYNWPN